MSAVRETEVVDHVGCPACLGALWPASAGFDCHECGASYELRDGYLDLLVPTAAKPSGLGPRLMHARPLARIYEELWRPAFVATFSSGRPSFDDELSAIQNHLAPAAGGIVLDLSCGPGVVGRRLAASRRYHRVYGLDRSPAMLAECVRRCRAERLDDMPLLLGDAMQLPFFDEVLDAIHVGAALHLWPSPGLGLAEASRVLVDGGVFVATTFIAGHSGRLRRGMERVLSGLSSVRVFDEDELEAVADAVGLQDFELERRGGFGMLRCVKRRRLLPDPPAPAR